MDVDHYVGCVLRRRRCVNRVNWAHSQQRWLKQQTVCNNVLFSDESRFSIHRADGRVSVYCRRHERNAASCCVLKMDRFFGVFFVFFGVFLGVCGLSWSWHALHMTFALISSLSKVIWMLPNATEIIFLRGMLHSFIHDNATSHTYRNTMNFTRANKIAFINDCTPKSPDLNPIEQFLDHLDVLDVALFHSQTSFG
jgi:hypothetical protein